MAKANSTPRLVHEGPDSTTLLATETIQQAFGNHHEDVIAPIKTGADALGWLEEICEIIREEAGTKKPNIDRIEKLADAGSYLACNTSNCCLSQYEELVENLAKAGIKIGGAA